MMSACKQCGFEMSEGSLFCSQCGSPASIDNPALPAEIKPRYCPKCNAVIPTKCDRCLICGSKEDELPELVTHGGVEDAAGTHPEPVSGSEKKPDTPPEEQSSDPEDTAEAQSEQDYGSDEVPDITPEQPVPDMPQPSRRPDKKNRSLIVFGLVLAALLSLSAALLWFYHALPYLGLTNSYRAKAAIIYVGDGGRLMFKTPSMSGPEEITGNFHVPDGADVSGLAKSSANGRYIAYLKNYSEAGGGHLYLRDFGTPPTLEPSENNNIPVMENVVKFFFTDNDALVFLTASGELCSMDFGEIRPLDVGVAEIIAHGGGKILYRKSSGETPGSAFYTCSAAPLSDGAALIDGNILELSDYTQTLDRFIYLHGQSDGSRDIVTYDVKQGVRRTLAVGVDSIISADASTFTVMYQTISPSVSLRYENLIDDEFAISDSLLKEPDIEDYPILAEYYDRYDIDDEQTIDIENLEELSEASDEFYTAIEEYEKKLERDKLRAQINKDIDELAAASAELYNLHLFTGDQPEIIASGSLKPFDKAVIYADSGFAVWSTAYYKMSSRIPLSKYGDIIREIGLRGYLDKMTGDDVYFRQRGYDSERVQLYAGDGLISAGNWQITEKADGLYFTAAVGKPSRAYESNAYTLYYTPIQNGSMKNIYLIDKNVSGDIQMLDGDKLLYYRDTSGGLCDLYVTNGGSGERIGTETTLLGEYFKIVNDDKTLLYFEHFNTGAGELFMLTKQARQLATGVHLAYYRSDSLVYLLRDFKDGKGDLYSFGSDGLVLIDKNIASVLE